jgi:hypothetical protein
MNHRRGYVIRIARVTGRPTTVAATTSALLAVGKYVVAYDPQAHDEEHLGGVLELTTELNKAHVFKSAVEAWSCYQQGSGRTRPDGAPDRPLTAFGIEIITVKSVAVGMP